jgi:hypothetical protein
VQFGQSRVLLVWNRLIFPNERSIVLERQPGADAEGYAGLQNRVDYHWWDLAKAAGLSTLLSVGAELATNDDDRLIQAIRNGGQDTINDARPATKPIPWQQPDGALTGGAIGAGTGAVVGSTMGHPLGGALVGGLGAAATGAATTPRRDYCE